MHNRCSNPANPKFHNYGGRGIAVCDRWRDFQAFYDDMGDMPSPEHTIERIDNDGPYAPNNCRWATRIEQGANMRTNHLITHNGQTLTLTEWARKTRVPLNRLRTRLERGVPFADAISKTYRYRPRRISDRSNIVEFQGVSLTLTDWAKRLGLHRNTLDNRIKRGWMLERALRS